MITHSETLELAKASVKDLPGGNIVLVVPDSTRSGTDYIGQIIRGIYLEVAPRVEHLTAIVALGTHAPMTDEAIRSTFGFSEQELAQSYPKLRLVNHEWKEPNCLRQVGVFTREDMLRISDGRFDLQAIGFPEGFPIEVNYRIPEADAVVIIGPVLNHEVVGKSGGNKYFFPGTSGPRGTQFTHWLGACITLPKIIGIEQTPVRKAIDFMASKITKPLKRCFCLVLDGNDLAHLTYGTPEEAHREAAPLIDRYQTVFVEQPYKKVVSLLSKKYPELWTGGKGSYKVQGVVADGGELIIYAPHLDTISASWGEMIERVGYHTMPYIQAHLASYLKDNIPLGVLAHSTHVMGTGSFIDGVEKPRIRVSLASQLSRETCDKINLNYLDFKSLDLDQMRADPDTLVVENSGEILYLLKSDLDNS